MLSGRVASAGDGGSSEEDGDADEDAAGTEATPSDSAVFKPIPVVQRQYSLADVRKLVDECPEAELLPPRLPTFIHRGMAISTSAQEVLDRPASAEEL